MKMAPNPVPHTIPEKLFLRTRQDAEEKYKDFQPTYCPYLKDVVHFDTKGLDHIKFKDWGKIRVRSDQYIRFKLLHLAPSIVSTSHTVQGIFEEKGWVRRKKHFRSIIPFWKMNKEKNVRTLHDGDVKNDGDLEEKVDH